MLTRLRLLADGRVQDKVWNGRARDVRRPVKVGGPGGHGVARRRPIVRSCTLKRGSARWRFMQSQHNNTAIGSLL